MEFNQTKAEKDCETEEPRTPLPQWGLLDEAWTIGHPDQPGSMKDLADASKLYEKAVEMTAVGLNLVACDAPGGRSVSVSR